MTTLYLVVSKAVRATVLALPRGLIPKIMLYSHTVYKMVSKKGKKFLEIKSTELCKLKLVSNIHW